ncbi:NAD(P)/FAD-dependent oxidoreductase [Fluviicola taffensis]|uniref:FAD-dependent pyridine nucleotide-disulfide oxidoreductase n=1 Tax=Fluviicola taffensis (strain DSM 16823 / NCIMB 13979 / RW262) TaxID=755732 RepID=F2IGC9_FLUTR|nr:NAD(P)/FAD-dependent oxidoreductase [Fluviicola taffensis]AEA45795.1 FAD-dependent pyridine nucleotide-disulfide oxidoreductase [Fluviicola taffensis DSM 16823]
MTNIIYDTIIIGGSYSGLSAGMALGRALKQVLIIDSGRPCNAQTPHSHNFITQDGETPQAITLKAREQVAKYKTVTFHSGLAIDGEKTAFGFEITTEIGEVFAAKKLIFATGVKDLMPEIKGATESWGISMIHCPYCHGYEVRNEKTGILANGEMAFQFSKLINNWTKELTLFTNGKSTLTAEQTAKLEEHGINLIETEIEAFDQTNGFITHVYLKDGSKLNLKAMYAKLPFVQHSDIPQKLGCTLTEQGFIQVDEFQKTTIPGVFACGDNTTPMRSVANVVAQGTLAGVMVSRELIDDEF